MGRLGIVVALALVACGKAKAPPPPPPPPPPVSGADAEALATQFITATAPCVPARIDALLDVDRVIDAAFTTSGLPAAKRDAFVAGARYAGQVGEQLCGGPGGGPEVALLRVRTVDGQPRPLLRLINPNSGLSYQELVVQRTAAGPRVVDLFLYATGELLSQTMASDAMMTISGAYSDADLEAIRRLDAIPLDAHAEARLRIAQMPAHLRDSHAMRRTDLRHASALGGDDAGAVLDRYRRDFPGDPVVEFAAIDVYFARREVAPLLATIDRLDRRVEGDPYLDFMRGSAYLLEPSPANLATAERLARAVTASYPTRVEGWSLLAMIQGQRRDHAGLCATFDRLIADFQIEVDPAAMRASDEFRDFAASPEFAAWWQRAGHAAP